MAGSSNITLHLTAGHAKFLERHGGRSHRGKGPFSRTVVLRRMLDSLRLYHEFTDPRETRGMSHEHHALVISLLPKPWELSPYKIRNLEGILAAAPGFEAAVAAASVNRADLLAIVAAATPAEKLTLVDHAIQTRLPRRPWPAPKCPDQRAGVGQQGSELIAAHRFELSPVSHVRDDRQQGAPPGIR